MPRCDAICGGGACALPPEHIGPHMPDQDVGIRYAEGFFTGQNAPVPCVGIVAGGRSCAYYAGHRGRCEAD